MTKEIKQELIAKIHELEWKNNIKSFEIINWINDLLKKYPCEEKKVEEVKKEIKVELPEEKKPAPKRKISFIKKK
jgi:hypothetical protein